MERTEVKNYQELFDWPTKVPNKILVKGDPGIGKTTLAKKIALDWANEKFSKVSIVLFVYLELVQPHDSLENAMIEQIPELEGLHVSPSKLESFIEHFGERCLLILDGLDGHAIGSNTDVLKVLQRRKYLSCNIILTSRPHSTRPQSTRQTQQIFDTIISVEGFTDEEARTFASHIVQNEEEVDLILDYNLDYKELYKCPLFLLLICILVRDKEVDLTNKTMPTGEIYTLMVQRLYKKFTIRKRIKYDNGELTNAVGLVGKLAWEILLLKKCSLERSRVEREVGKYAFDYGFLVGHEDMIDDVKADIRITFPHISIQKFFGAFGFICWLNNKENRSLDLESAEQNRSLDLESAEQIVLKNPLFLHFCFWFLSERCSGKYFPVKNMKTACRFLHEFLLKRIQCRELNLKNVVKCYPALNVLGSVRTGDDINAEHFGRIIEMLDKVQCVTLRYYDPIEWILNHIKSTLTLIVVEDDSEESQHNVFPQERGNNLNIVLSGKACTPGVIKCVLQRAARWDRPPVVYLFLTEGNSVDISEILHLGMHELHVNGTTKAQTKVVASNDLRPCPFLTQLCVKQHIAKDESVMRVISEAFKDKKISKIKKLNLMETN